MPPSSSSVDKWGKEGLRQFLFSLRKSAVGGGESAYKEALKVEPDEFDDLFERYLMERFRPFRDKERPVDYGRNLAPIAGPDALPGRPVHRGRRRAAT